MAGKVDTPDMRFTNNARYFQDGSSLTIAFEGRHIASRSARRRWA